MSNKDTEEGQLCPRCGFRIEDGCEGICPNCNFAPS